jgi:hypothetical protein
MAKIESATRKATIPDPNEVAVRLKNIKPGERVLYYVGHLAEDRASKKRATELDKTHLENANLAYQVAPAHLVQRRRPDGAGFDYLAIGMR